MSKLFVFTAGNPEARRHWDETIASPIAPARVLSHCAPDKRSEIEAMAKGAEGIYAWGAIPGERNIPNWEALAMGDIVLGVFSAHYQCAARVIGKQQNQALARELWGENADGETWEYMYFLDRPFMIGVPVNDLADYLQTHYWGFTKIPDTALDRIVGEFGSLANFLYQRLHVSFADNGSEAQRLTALEQEIAKLRPLLAAKAQRLTALEQEITKLRPLLAAKAQRLTALEQEITKLRPLLAAEAQRLTDLEQEIAKLKRLLAAIMFVAALALVWTF